LKTFSPDKEAHIPVLDGLRGMAVLMVLLFHFWQGLPVYQHPFSPEISRGLSLFSIGQKGVDLFFVLSGFLITGILLRTRGAAHYFKNFYIRRSLRIFPLYYAVVLGCILVGVIWPAPEFQWHKTWWYLCYLQNIGMTFWPGSVGEPGHFWSLAVEEHFYLFWPLVVLWLNRRQLLYFSLGLVVLSIIVRAVFLRLGLDVFTFTFCRMDTLALGALLAILFGDDQHWQTTKTWVARTFLPLAGLTLGSFFVLSGTASPLLQTFKYTLFAGLCGAVLVLSLSPGRWNPLPWLFNFAWLRGLGKTSYAMYVFHPFIYAGVMGRLYAAGWSPVRSLFWPALLIELALALGLTILASRLSWMLFEQPLIKLKTRFQYEDRNRLTPPGPVAESAGG
jgi:peptidoglycan/LPS O-acetylase OafA/YrhL